jgi:hypothetical protein
VHEKNRAIKEKLQAKLIAKDDVRKLNLKDINK